MVVFCITLDDGSNGDCSFSEILVFYGLKDVNTELRVQSGVLGGGRHVCDPNCNI